MSHTPASKHREAAQRAHELPALDMARVAIAHAVTNKAGRTCKPVLSGGALRVLLALVASTDAAGRVSTGAGANVLFDSKTYYQHLAALEDAGHLRKIVRSRSTKRHAEVTSTGQALAAKVGRLIEKDARQFISDATFVA